MRAPRRRGVTILEVLGVIFILSLGITALASAMSNALTMLRYNHVDLLAKAACRQQMERLRNLPFDDPASTNDLVAMGGTTTFTEGLTDAIPPQLPGAIGRIYICDLDLTVDPPTCETTLPFGNTNMLRVTVSVQANLQTAQAPVFELIPSAYAAATQPSRGVWRLVTWVTRCGMNPSSAGPCS